MDPTSSRTARAILVASAFATVGSLPVFLLGAQGALVMADLDQNETFLGLAIGTFYASAALTILVAGRAIERLGSRYLVLVGGLLSAAANLSIGAGAESVAATLLAVVGLGAANAALQLSANLSLSTSIPPTRRGLGFGVKQAAAPLAIMLAGLALPIVGTTYGWRASYLGLTIVGLLIAIAGLTANKPERPSKTAGSAGPEGPPRRAMWSSVAAMALASAALTSVGSYASSWAIAVGLTLTQTGLLIAVGSGLNIIGRLLSGGLADRRVGRHLPVVYRQMLIGGVALLLVSINSPVTFVPAAIIAMTIGWSWPGLFLFAVLRVGRERTASASGWLQAGAFAGGASGPLLFGLIAEHSGYPLAWQVAGVAMIASAVLVIVARRDFISDLAIRPLPSSSS